MQEKGADQFQEEGVEPEPVETAEGKILKGVDSGTSSRLEIAEGGGEMTEEELSRDRKILHEVTREAVSEAGNRIDIAFIVDMLHLLEQRFGNNFRLEGAYKALERLRETADMMERELRKASETEKIEF